MVIYNLFLIVALLFSFLLLFVITSAFFGFLLTKVPFVPTSAAEVEFIAKKLGISSLGVFYDLGSGDGKVCFIVNRITGAKCVGFELTWWTHLLAEMKLKVKYQNSNLKFKNQDFFKANWSEADYIYGYLYPMVMGKVEKKFLANCKPGSVAIIRDFPFPNLKPTKIYYMPRNHEVYIYKI